jgi:hypothetical protein
MFSQRKRWVWMAFLVWLIVPGALVVNMILRVPAGPGFPSAAALAWFTLCAVKIVDADRGNHAVPPALKILGWIVLLAVLTAATFVALWFAACALLLTMSTLGK